MLNEVSGKHRTCFIVFLITLFFYTGIFHIFPENKVFHLLQKDYGGKEKDAKGVFKLVALDGVFTFANVCIEPLSTPSPVNIFSIWFTVTQRIVIYDRSQSRLGDHRLNIAGPPGHPWNYYDVHFTNKSVPVNNRTMSDNVAFFVSPRCPGNLHHFFQEEYMTLYSVIRLTNRLHPGSGNLILYTTPKPLDHPFCRNFRTFNEILRTLFTNDFHDVYFNLPRYTCFKNAVFGSRIELNNSRDVVNHVIKQYNLSDACAYKKAQFTTLVYRKQRRIANMEDLQKWVLESGFKKEFVRVIDFDGIPNRNQIELACTSQVMIGVNGAALQWAMFMPEKSHLVEMAWPSRSWLFFYQPYIPKFGILYHQIALKDIRVNLTSFELRERNGIKMSDAERQQVLSAPPQGAWNWADAFIHEGEVNTTLLAIFNSIFNRSSSIV
jgi:hypothetical protein